MSKWSEIKDCIQEIGFNIREVFGFLLSVLGLISIMVISLYIALSPIAITFFSGDWQWLLMYVVYVLFLYLCYRIFK